MDFLDKQVPEDWQSWPLDRRRMFWGGAVQGEVKLVDRVRALETLWKLLEASEPQQADPLLQALAALPGETGDWNEK